MHYIVVHSRVAREYRKKGESKTSLVARSRLGIDNLLDSKKATAFSHDVTAIANGGLDGYRPACLRRAAYLSDSVNACTAVWSPGGLRARFPNSGCAYRYRPAPPHHCRLAPSGRPVCVLRPDWSSLGWLLSVDFAPFSGCARGFPCCWSVSPGSVGRWQLESSPAPRTMLSKSVRMNSWTHAPFSASRENCLRCLVILCGYSGALHFVRSESNE